MNRFIGMGRITADPEVRYTQNNVSIAHFTLAINRKGKPQDGQPTADFIKIVAFKTTADFIGKYFKKGMQVLVEGQLRNNDWTDKEGNKRRDSEILADAVYFAEGRKNDSDRQDYHPQSENASTGTTAPVATVPAATGGDGFYTLNEDSEDLTF